MFEVSGTKMEHVSKTDKLLTDDGVEVSVVIPCLNEANSVGICVEKACKAVLSAGLKGEVIVAGNGSTDGSQEIARNYGARVVPVPQLG